VFDMVDNVVLYFVKHILHFIVCILVNGYKLF